MARNSFRIPRQTRKGDGNAAITEQCCDCAAHEARQAQSYTAQSIKLLCRPQGGDMPTGKFTTHVLSQLTFSRNAIKLM